MTNSPNDSRLKDIANLIKAGDSAKAKQLLAEVLKANPQNADAWYFASFVTNEPDKRRSALERVLKINPQHRPALRQIEKLKESDPEPKPEPPSPVVPPPAVTVTLPPPTAKITPLAPSKPSMTPHASTPKIAPRVTAKPSANSEAPPQSKPSRRTPSRLPLALVAIIVVVAGIVLVRSKLINVPPPLAALLTGGDGKQILFGSDAKVYQVNSDGTGIVAVFDNFNTSGTSSWPGPLIWSPKGRHVIIQDRTKLITLEATGQHQKEIGEGRDPAWSPDGTLIAYAGYLGQQTDIYVVDPSGENSKQLTQIDTEDRSPIFSPDSRRIAFIRFDTAAPSIYMINIDGSGETKLTDGSQPQWSPDGRRLLFVRGSEDTASIYAINGDGSGEIKLTDGSQPQWSADSTTIFFLSKKSINRVKVDGSDLTTLGKADRYFPSPDGNYVALLTSENQLHIVDLKGAVVASGPRELWGEALAWSPSSQQLVMLARNTLYVTSLNGQMTPIVNDPKAGRVEQKTLSSTLLLWPDTDQLAGINAAVQAKNETRRNFAANQPDYFIIGYAPLRVASVSPQGSETLTHDSMFPEQDSVIGGDWSPDGKNIAVMLGNSKNPSLEGVFIMAADGSSFKKLTDGSYPHWSPDGKRIAFRLGKPIDGSLYVIDADGKSASTKVSDKRPDLDWYEWSPDSRQLLYTFNDNITIANADGSGEISLGRGEDAHWSPDGKQIVFVDDYDTYITDTQGSARVKLVDGGTFPAWSPDGSRIAFNYQTQIHVINPDGSNMQQVTNSKMWANYPEWSADSKRIVYHIEDVGELMMINVDGSGQIRLSDFKVSTMSIFDRWLPPLDPASLGLKPFSSPITPTVRPPIGNAELQGQPTATFAQSAAVLPTHTPNVVPTLAPTINPSPIPPTVPPPTQVAIIPTASNPPDLSKLGGTLALVIYKTSNIGKADIYSVNFDGSNLKQLTTVEGDDLSPRWSPDGQRLVFVSTRDGIPQQDGGKEIYTMNADGSDQKRLTVNHTDDLEPHWSPDGTRIAFSSWRDGNMELYIMNADGSDQKRLTKTPELEEMSDWSPDGSKLLYVVRSGTDQPRGTVRVMNSDGTGVTSLNLSGRDPAWSPDGTRIIYTYDTGIRSSIYMTNANGTNAQRISRGEKSEDSHPSWSSDGQYILFIANGGGKRCTCLMNLDGSGVQVITTLGESMPDTAWTAQVHAANVAPFTVEGTRVERLVFTRNDQIIVTNPNGTIPIPLVFQDGVRRTSYAISPDGLTIAYTTEINGLNKVFLMNIDGSDMRRPVTTKGWEDNIAWSPDSKQIAFTSQTQIDNKNHQAVLYIVDIDGQNLRQVVNHSPNFFIERISWSPDGKQLLYTHDIRDANLGYVGKEFYVINTDGTGEKVLVSSGDDHDAVYSPDGKQIAYISLQAGEWNLYVMDVTGGNVRQLSFETSAVNTPIWSPDGKRIIYGVYGNNNRNDYYIVDLESLAITRLSDKYERIVFWGMLPEKMVPPGKQ